MTTTSTTFKQTDIGPIPEEWEVVNIGEALEIIDGDRGVNYPNESDFLEGDYCLFLNAKNVCGDSFDFSNCQFISKKKDLQLRKGKMQRGDFVLTTRGTVGNIAFYDKSIPFENMRINSGMVILRNGTDFDSKYLFQLLKSLVIKNQIIELTTGSAQPQLPIRDINFLKLVKPPLREQCRIAEILSSLDDKIELNRKINANLEKLASTLFKKWFIDISDKLPEGWGMELMTGYVDIDKGLSYKGSDLNDDGENILVGLKCFERGGGFRFDGTKRFNGEFKKQHLLKSGDLIIAMTDLTQGAEVLGKPAIVPNIKNAKNVIASLDVSILRPKTEKISKAYLYLFFMRQETQDYLFGFSNGSTVLHLSIDVLRKIMITVPPDNEMKTFNALTVPIFEQIQILEDEIQNLSQIRDSLLPRLMSGKIRTKI